MQEEKEQKAGESIATNGSMAGEANLAKGASLEDGTKATSLVAAGASTEVASKTNPGAASATEPNTMGADAEPRDGAPADTTPASVNGTAVAPHELNAKALRVEVSLRVGTLSISLEEAGKLAPGYTIKNADGVIFPRIEALSNHRVFAEGELVEIGGKIGFRITRLVE